MEGPLQRRPQRLASPRASVAACSSNVAFSAKILGSSLPMPSKALPKHLGVVPLVKTDFSSG
jgi:hypothetical protein